MTRGDLRARAQLADEAARLMLDEDVGQYFVAKRMAAKRLFGCVVRPHDLPSNGEIQAALLRRVKGELGPAHGERLDAMRRAALRVMRRLEEFEPRLIGSVATGHIHRESDIDIHVFADDTDAPERWLRERRVPHERDDVLIRRPTGFVEYQHLRLDGEPPVELTVHPRRDLRMRPRSSTDGKPIQRLSIHDVEALLSARAPGPNEDVPM